MLLKRYAVSAALFTVALAGLTVSANAENYRGTFTLPVEAHWGGVNLQPGQYTILTSTLGSTPVIYLTGQGEAVSILAGNVISKPSSEGKGQLELTEINGKQFVTRLVTSNTGREYKFSIPKSAQTGFGAVALQKTVVPVP